MSEFLDLNDACLYNVCAFLVLEDLLKLKKTCRHMDLVVKSFWRNQCKVLSLSYFEMKAFKEEQDFVDRMTCVCDTLEELSFDTMNSVKLRWIAHLRFPKLNILQCRIYSKRGVHDEDVRFITQMCPNITKLELEGETTGKYIVNLHLLTELDLSFCHNLDTVYLAEICQTLKLRKLSLFCDRSSKLLNVATITKCQTLEEIKIYEKHLMTFIDELLVMPRMRKIICCEGTAGCSLMGKLTLAHGMMPNLQRFIVQSNMIPAELKLLAPCLKQLREFHFNNSSLKNENEILEIVKRCKKLEVLNFTISHVSGDFLQKLVAILSETKREPPLKFYCRIDKELDLETEELVVSNYDPLFRLPHARRPYFQCEW